MSVNKNYIRKSVVGNELVVGKLYELQRDANCTPYNGETTEKEVLHLYNNVTMSVRCRAKDVLLYLGHLMTLFPYKDDAKKEELHLFLHPDGKIVGAWGKISFFLKSDLKLIEPKRKRRKETPNP
jgi:hypothetical protein